MFNKRKILYSAIVATLVTQAGVAMAGGLSLLSPKVTPTGSTTATNATVASEQINALGSSDKIPSTSQFAVQYQTSNTVNSDFTMTYTLSGGATWSTALDSTSLTSTTNGLAITRTAGGTGSDSSVEFTIRTGSNTALNSGAGFTFSFDIADKAGVLSVAGSEIKLAAALALPFSSSTPVDTTSTTKEVVIVNSKDGLKTTFDGSAATTGNYAIDVAQGSTVFVNNTGTSSSYANLGNLTLASNSAQKITDLTSTWSLSDATSVTGTLVITSAPFNASTTSSTGVVFIDTDGNNVYDAPTTSGGTTTYKDLKAKTVNDTDATWELVKDELTRLNTSCGSGCPILIQADGTTVIQDSPEPAMATLTLKYDKGDRTTTSKLAHIRRNGTVCTLYNIPAPGAADTLSVRVTNTSNQAGIVLGTLRALDGSTLFTNAELIPELAPNATARISAEDLEAANGGTGWTGRAVLILSSNIKSGYMEAYGLVRNTQGGGPLMNLSTGASGNGCD
jgi:hypothetical protein